MIFLDKLSAQDSVEVFLDQTTAGSLSAQEIYDMLILD